ncbi:MAG: hypothetical protein WCC26_05590 [Terracidiphilus sp.]
MHSLWKLPARRWAQAFEPFRRIGRRTARVDEDTLRRALSLTIDTAIAMRSFIAQQDAQTRLAQENAWRAAWRARSGDMIVIDLRPQAQQHELPVVETPSHAVSTGELMRALEQMPPERPAVLCVVTSDCIFLLDRNACMRISGPLGALESVVTRLDAA